jgi:hypothetical protein
MSRGKRQCSRTWPWPSVSSPSNGSGTLRETMTSTPITPQGDRPQHNAMGHDRLHWPRVLHPRKTHDPARLPHSPHRPESLSPRSSSPWACCCRLSTYAGKGNLESLPDNHQITSRCNIFTPETKMERLHTLRLKQPPRLLALENHRNPLNT